jgi:hypothetical protein
LKQIPHVPFFSFKFATSPFPTPADLARSKQSTPTPPAAAIDHHQIDHLHNAMRAFLVLVALAAIGANATITTVTDMPGFSAMRQCVQYPLSFAVEFDMQCDNNVCFCDRFPEALTRLTNSVLTSSCSGTDIVSATSMLRAFCEQIPSLTYTNFGAPVATGAGATSVAAGTGGGGGGAQTTVVATATPAQGNSGTPLIDRKSILFPLCAFDFASADFSYCFDGHDDVHYNRWQRTGFGSNLVYCYHASCPRV